MKWVCFKATHKSGCACRQDMQGVDVGVRIAGPCTASYSLRTKFSHVSRFVHAALHDHCCRVPAACGTVTAK
jgi:hypothetical protein